jgi:hypothetical protein
VQLLVPCLRSVPASHFAEFNSQKTPLSIDRVSIYVYLSPCPPGRVPPPVGAVAVLPAGGL